MRPSLLLRYLRLLTWYTEARLSYFLSRTLADTLQLLWVGLTTLIALLCLSTALLLAIAGPLGFPIAFLVTGLLWLLIATISRLLLRPWLHKRFQIGRHLYRMNLARSGLRLLEEKLLDPSASAATLSPLLAPLLSVLSRWLWKWAKTGFRLILRKIIPL